MTDKQQFVEEHLHMILGVFI